MRFTVFILLLFALATHGAERARGDFSTNRTSINTTAEADFTTKQSEQTAWKSSRPRYRQESSAVISATADGTLTREVHEYLGPQGTGYTVIYTYTDSVGVKTMKRRHVGPETYREHDWVEASGAP